MIGFVQWSFELLNGWKSNESFGSRHQINGSNAMGLRTPTFYRELLELFQNESTVLFGHPIEHIGNVILHE